MRDREGWDSLEDDVEFVRPVEKLDIYNLEYQLAVHVQPQTLMGVVSTNGHHHTRKGVLGGGGGKPLRHNLLKIQTS
jgi:hypothetical protein